MVHVYPVNDTREHELEGTCCWCEPHVDWDQPEAVVVHNSADGRELREKREEDEST
jgi:hypothetical protein